VTDAHPDLTRITRLERRWWSRALLKQSETEGSTYCKNLERTGNSGAVLVGVANFWLGLSFPFVVSIFIFGFLGQPLAQAFGVAVSSLLIGTAGLRVTQGIREGRRWRSEHGLPSKAVRSKPSATASPPVGWAVQTPIKRSKESPGQR
jgi:hypothetical protein